MSDPVDVFVEIDGRDVLAGRLWANRTRNGESQIFRYSEDYLSNPNSYDLDPTLSRESTTLATPNDRAIFGAFSDCAPDRWGETLIERAELKRAKAAKVTPRSHGKFEYLIGVRDDLRQGALRFRRPGEDVFLADEASGVPTLIDLPELITTAEKIDKGKASVKEIEDLIRGGSSLGGARPKAHVIDGGKIAIAKFPRPSTDEWDVMRWEAISLELARRAGLHVPPSRHELIAGKSVMIVERFDRDASKRIGYVSALTMLERTNSARGSYIEIAEVIEQESSEVDEDLRELWRRIAFSVLISNFDDHLRNHGFLRASTSGWRLSPAFDLNPSPAPGERHLTTAIDDTDTRASIDLVVEVASAFRLDDADALKVLAEVTSATAQWRDVAAEFDAAPEDIERMEIAFEHEEAARAKALTS